MTYISSIADESDEFSLLAPQAGGAAPSFRSLPSQSAFSDLLIRAVILSRAAKHVEQSGGRVRMGTPSTLPSLGICCARRRRPPSPSSCSLVRRSLTRRVKYASAAFPRALVYRCRHACLHLGHC